MHSRRSVLRAAVGLGLYGILQASCGTGNPSNPSSTPSSKTPNTATPVPPTAKPTKVTPSPTPFIPTVPTEGFEGVFDYLDGNRVRVYFEKESGFREIAQEYQLTEVLDAAFRLYGELIGQTPRDFKGFTNLAYVPIPAESSNALKYNPLEIAIGQYTSPPGWYHFIHETGHPFTILHQNLAQQRVFGEGLVDSSAYTLMDSLSRLETLSQKTRDSMRGAFEVFDGRVEDMRQRMHSNGVSISGLNSATEYEGRLDSYSFMTAVFKDIAGMVGWEKVNGIYQRNTESSVYFNSPVSDSVENATSAFFGILANVVEMDIRDYLSSIGVSVNSAIYESQFVK